MNAPLPNPSLVRHVGDEHFDAAFRAASFVLVKFTGTWCPPCRLLAPTVEAIARDRPGLAVLSVDVDEAQRTAERFGIRAVPTLIAFKNGRPIGQLVGNQSRAMVEKLLGD